MVLLAMFVFSAPFDQLRVLLVNLIKSKIFVKLSVSLPGGPAPTSNVLRDPSSRMVDAEDNTGTHGFILFRPFGRTSSKDLRVHCTISHRGACSRWYK